MSAINADTAEGWRKIAAQLEAQRPSAGKTVRVVGGRKHKGKIGTVQVHKLSRYSDAYRYASEAQAHMRDMRGRDGWVCRVLVLGAGSYSEAVWIDARHLEVIKVHTDGDGNETIEVVA